MREAVERANERAVQIALQKSFEEQYGTGNFDPQHFEDFQRQYRQQQQQQQEEEQRQQQQQQQQQMSQRQLQDQIQRQQAQIQQQRTMTRAERPPLPTQSSIRGSSGTHTTRDSQGVSLPFPFNSSSLIPMFFSLFHL